MCSKINIIAEISRNYNLEKNTQDWYTTRSIFPGLFRFQNAKFFYIAETVTWNSQNFNLRNIIFFKWASISIDSSIFSLLKSFWIASLRPFFASPNTHSFVCQIWRPCNGKLYLKYFLWSEQSLQGFSLVCVFDESTHFSIKFMLPMRHRHTSSFCIFGKGAK